MQEPGFPWSYLQETKVEQLFPCSLWREPHWSRQLQCSLQKGPCQCKWICPKGTVQDPTQEQFIPEGLQPMRKIYTKRGGKHEKKEAERKYYGLIALFVISLSSLRVRWKQTSGNEGIKLSLGKHRSRRMVVQVLALFVSIQIYFNW